MTRAETLDRAKQCVCGQRENEYGSPEDNFRTIAALWSVYKNTDFTSTDVAMMMALLKIARIKTGTATEDSFVDLAGYAACGAEIASVDKITVDKITDAISRIGSMFQGYKPIDMGSNGNKEKEKEMV